MLRRLTIRDFVIVDCLELEFEAGFGTLTGETGAGKSILLDALGLALGDRGDGSTVRAGQDKADIVAEFDLPDGPLLQWLADSDLPSDDGLVLLRRVIDAGGRSRGWINGVPVTLAQLREAGEWLADIHGQHAHHALLRPEAQRRLLDVHAGVAALAGEVAELHRVWQRLAVQREAAEGDAAVTQRQRELLVWQIEELETLGFRAEEWGELDAEQRRLGHAAGLIDPALAEVRELVSGALIQVDEAVHGLRRYQERLDLDPARLQEVEARIAAINDVARKHRVQPESLPELLTGWRRELAELEERADPTRLAAAEAEARKRWEEAAQKLSASRRPAAERLSREVSEAMQSMAMPGGGFEVALLPREKESAHGLEDIEFRVTANPSQPLRPLAKVASGGELSRIGLAIQVMTSRDTAVPTLIFDEVDVGIGGAVAERVGQLLQRLGRDRQVLCVTHLPQVAACAEWQWNIAKVQRDGEVLSAVTTLDRSGRVEELARMLGGLEITDKTRGHAEEMLTLAAARARQR
jgi:DNA repair protein RecN (Recombination protein N)